MNKQDFLILSKTCLLELPDTIEFKYSVFDVSSYSQSLFQHYGVDMPQSLQSAVNKRCAEYLAGRIVARQAIERINGTKPQIGTHKDRSPIWPKGLIGSITHSDRFAAAALAQQKYHQFLGIDFEHWINAQLADELSGQILDKYEKQLLSQCSISFEQGVTLIFSAKESFYKALYPHVKTFFGFDEARVSSMDVASGRFTIELLTSFGDEFEQGWAIKGNFKMLPDGILTYIFY